MVIFGGESWRNTLLFFVLFCWKILRVGISTRENELENVGRTLVESSNSVYDKQLGNHEKKCALSLLRRKIIKCRIWCGRHVCGNADSEFEIYANPHSRKFARRKVVAAGTWQRASFSLSLYRVEKWCFMRCFGGCLAFEFAGAKSRESCNGASIRDPRSRMNLITVLLRQCKLLAASRDRSRRYKNAKLFCYEKRKIIDNY